MLGYRVWSLVLDEKKNPILKSVVSNFVWKTNVVGNKIDKLYEIDTYRQRYRENESKEWESIVFNIDGSQHNENFGFFAFSDPEIMLDEFLEPPTAYVAGVVNGFGKIHRHEHGFRSEFSQVIGFYNHIGCLTHPETSGHLYFPRFYPEGLSFCQQCIQSTAMKFEVQIAHDKVLRDLSRRYESRILDGAFLQGGEK